MPFELPVPSPDGSALARKADLNVLFTASLEFGANWRRPVEELAKERLSGRSLTYQSELSRRIDECRSTVEGHVEWLHVRNGRQWPRYAVRDADEWIATHYPWMSKRNRRRAIKQGQYYAWRNYG